MKWKYKTIQELNGGSLSSNMVRVARAVNHNAYLLKEAVQKIEELSEKIDILKNRIDELLNGEEK
jgi:hypothetical protein